MTVKDYLAKLPGTETFLAIDETEQDKWIFQAKETILDVYGKRYATDRIIAIQTMFMFEGESEDFAMLRRQDVDTFSTEGLSVKFKNGNSVSPQVVAIIEQSGRAFVGSII